MVDSQHPHRLGHRVVRDQRRRRWPPSSASSPARSCAWRVIWPGALLGGAALTVLQFGAGLLLSYTPSNPLLATFAIFVGLLLWFQLIGIIMLVAAAWIAVASKDQRHPAPAADRGRADRRRARGAPARRAGAAAHGAGGPRGRALVPRVARRLRRARSGGRAAAGRGVRPALPAPSKKQRSSARQCRGSAAASGACPGRSIGWRACLNASASPRSTSTESARRCATA